MLCMTLKIRGQGVIHRYYRLTNISIDKYTLADLTVSTHHLGRWYTGFYQSQNLLDRYSGRRDFPLRHLVKLSTHSAEAEAGFVCSERTCLYCVSCQMDTVRVMSDVFTYHNILGCSCFSATTHGPRKDELYLSVP